MATKNELNQRLVNSHVITEKDMHCFIDVAGVNDAKGDPGEKEPKGDQGAKGDPGDPGAKEDLGAKGVKGDPGAKGVKRDPVADVFGTEAQYNDSMARLA